MFQHKRQWLWLKETARTLIVCSSVRDRFVLVVKVDIEDNIYTCMPVYERVVASIVKGGSGDNIYMYSRAETVLCLYLKETSRAIFMYIPGQETVLCLYVKETSGAIFMCIPGQETFLFV